MKLLKGLSIIYNDTRHRWISFRQKVQSRFELVIRRNKNFGVFPTSRHQAKQLKLSVHHVLLAPKLTFNLHTKKFVSSVLVSCQTFFTVNDTSLVA